MKSSVIHREYLSIIFFSLNNFYVLMKKILGYTKNVVTRRVANGFRESVLLKRSPDPPHINELQN